MGLNANALDELCVKPVLLLDGIPDLVREEGRFRTNSGSCVTLRSEPLVAFSRALAKRPGSFTAFPDVLTAAQEVANRAFTVAEVSKLREDLLSLFVRRQLDLSGAPFTPPAVVPRRPRLTPLNRAAARRRSIVVTAFHEASRINSAEQAFCELLDGSLNQEEILSHAVRGAAGEYLEPFLEALRNAGCLEP